MVDLSEECLDVLNGGHFTIVEPGPLHAPIQSFSIRRDEKLRLILETEVPPDATSAAVDHPPGTVRMNIERVMLRSIGGVDAEFMGVIPFSLTSNTVGYTEKSRKELAQVHIARTNYACQRRIKTRPARRRKNQPLGCGLMDMRTAPAGAVLMSAAIRSLIGLGYQLSLISPVSGS